MLARCGPVGRALRLLGAEGGGPVDALLHLARAASACQVGTTGISNISSSSCGSWQQWPTAAQQQQQQQLWQQQGQQQGQHQVRRPYVSGSGGGPQQAQAAPSPATASAPVAPAAAASPEVATTSTTSESPAAPSSAGGGASDAFALVREEIECVTERLRRDIFTEIPALERAAAHFFRAGAEGKRLRSTMLLLLASALAPAPPPRHCLATIDPAPPAEHPPELRRRQQRIAEITELIHVASLLHDDVLDAAGTRRGRKSINALWGNKVAILAGDFLLARASVSLSALRNPEAIMLMSQSLEALVAGEILQLTADADEAASLDHYLRKTHCKTAALMANSCKAVAVLGGHGAADCQAAWEYGRHLGLAFQLVDDIMDFTCSASEMGKPALNDLRSGLATAPVLYAADEHPALIPLIHRRFKEEGDVEAAEELVRASMGLERARQLAAYHAGEAAAAVHGLSPALTQHAAEHRQGLLEVTQRVLNRKK